MIIFYFDSAHVIIVHDMVIAISGGVPGVINIGQLESLVCHIQSDEYYPSFIDKLTHLIFGITKFHCFIDGNKRAGFLAAGLFSYANGYRLVCDQAAATAAVLALAASELDEASFAAWLRLHLQPR